MNLTVPSFAVGALARVGRVGAALLLLPLAGACKETPSRSGAPRADAPVESESPSAKIYPAPLETGAPRDAGAPDGGSSMIGSGSVPSASGGAPGKKSQRFVTRTLPLLGPIEPETVSDAEAAGFQLDLQVPWPEVQSTVQLHGQPIRLSPLLSIHLLPESTRHAARVRIELASGTLPLPPGTEFLASADAEGWLVIWPDHRSYRVVSASSLRSILEERRVDRMPLVSVEASSDGVGRLLGRDTRRTQFQSAVGTLLLESAEVPELGSAGALVCAFFLALLRADPRPHCQDGFVPVYARYQWAPDRALEVGALRLVARSEYRTPDFALPPRLGIFKPGELPPREGRPELDPANVWPDGEASASWRVLNHHEVPMYFLVDGLPVAWLDPHVERVVLVPPGEHRHAARDWLGQVLETGGIASQPPSASPGESESGPRVEGSSRPTVQYGKAPEPEIE